MEAEQQQHVAEQGAGPLPAAEQPLAAEPMAAAAAAEGMQVEQPAADTGAVVAATGAGASSGAVAASPAPPAEGAVEATPALRLPQQPGGQQEARSPVLPGSAVTPAAALLNRLEQTPAAGATGPSRCAALPLSHGQARGQRPCLLQPESAVVWPLVIHFPYHLFCISSVPCPLACPRSLASCGPSTAGPTAVALADAQFLPTPAATPAPLPSVLRQLSGVPQQPGEPAAQPGGVAAPAPEFRAPAPRSVLTGQKSKGAPAAQQQQQPVPTAEEASAPVPAATAAEAAAEAVPMDADAPPAAAAAAAEPAPEAEVAQQAEAEVAQQAVPATMAEVPMPVMAAFAAADQLLYHQPRPVTCPPLFKAPQGPPPAARWAALQLGCTGLGAGGGDGVGYQVWRGMQLPPWRHPCCA